MTPKQLRVLLRRLGSTPEGVAHSLMARGLRGVVDDAENCPVAAYLSEEGAESIAVNAQCIECEDFEVLTPRPIAHFVSQFDDGHWPELIEPQDPGGHT